MAVILISGNSSAADKAQYFRGKITTKGFTYYHT
jgi:hypothetical protein